MYTHLLTYPTHPDYYSLVIKFGLSKFRFFLLPFLYNTIFIPLSYIEHVKHEAYVQKRKYLCSVMAAIEKTTTHTHTLTHT